jgi:hypothetical protein
MPDHAKIVRVVPEPRSMQKFTGVSAKKDGAEAAA